MRKYIAEFIGTMTLVILGCGTAMLVGCDAVSGKLTRCMVLMVTVQFCRLLQF